MRAYTGNSPFVLRSDNRGYSASAVAAAFIGVLVVVVIALSLLSTVANTTKSAENNANLTTDQKNLLPLVVTFFILGIVVAAIAIIFVALHSAMSDG